MKNLESINSAIAAEVESLALHTATTAYQDDEDEIFLDLATWRHLPTKEASESRAACERVLLAARESFRVEEFGDGDGDGYSIKIYKLNPR